VRARGEELVGHGHRVDEARAHRLHVEGGALVDAEAELDLAGAGREGEVGRRGGADHEVDVGRGEPRMIERRARGADAEHRGVSCLGRDVALLDAGTLHDPLVRRVDHLGQGRIGEDALGQL
jgi:hypothetical protein